MLSVKMLITLTVIAMLTGCSGCSGIPGISINTVDSVDAELNIPETMEVAVVVPLFGAVSEKWAVAVEAALQNPRYSLVILWIESPGGGVVETKILVHKLQTFQKKYNKPIYIYSERILASGAYWVASTFEKIIISPAGSAGSIGVYMRRVDASEFYKKLGLTIHYIASDSTKVIGNDASKMPEWERAHWQASIDAIHLEFMQHVWKYRKVQLRNSCRDLLERYGASTKSVTDMIVFNDYFRYIANGFAYDAKMAYMFGLVDNVMYFDDFVSTLQSMGYTVITVDGKIITEFYPFEDKDVYKKKMKRKVRDHLQVKQK